MCIRDRFGTNLTQEAREGKLDPVIGREKEISRMMEILSRRTKNNPLILGDPGVGKTAIVEGLAQELSLIHISRPRRKPRPPRTPSNPRTQGLIAAG